MQPPNQWVDAAPDHCAWPSSASRVGSGHALRHQLGGGVGDCCGHISVGGGCAGLEDRLALDSLVPYTRTPSSAWLCT